VGLILQYRQLARERVDCLLAMHCSPFHSFLVTERHLAFLLRHTISLLLNPDGTTLFPPPRSAPLRASFLCITTSATPVSLQQHRRRSQSQANDGQDVVGPPSKASFEAPHTHTPRARARKLTGLQSPYLSPLKTLLSNPFSE